MFIILPLIIIISSASCGEIPKEGDGEERYDVKIELTYPGDNESTELNTDET